MSAPDFKIDELPDVDLSVFDPPVDLAEPYRHDGEAFRASIVRLESLNIGRYCGMTSRPAPYTATRLVHYTAGTRKFQLKVRFSGWEVARELEEWGRWLVQALGIGEPDGTPMKLAKVARIIDPPNPRLFVARVFMLPERKGRRRGR